MCKGINHKLFWVEHTAEFEMVLEALHCRQVELFFGLSDSQPEHR